MATSDRLFSLPKNVSTVSTVARLSLRRFFAEIARKEISVHWNFSLFCGINLWNVCIRMLGTRLTLCLFVSADPACVRISRLYSTCSATSDPSADFQGRKTFLFDNQICLFFKLLINLNRSIVSCSANFKKCWIQILNACLWTRLSACMGFIRHIFMAFWAGNAHFLLLSSVSCRYTILLLRLSPSSSNLIPNSRLSSTWIGGSNKRIDQIALLFSGELIL
jgi:hypothetical protein